MEDLNEYGWLEPDGSFHPSGWGHHADCAGEFIVQRGMSQDFSIWLNEKIKQPIKIRGTIGFPGDFLVNQRGWVLLHSPGGGAAFPTYNEIKGLTNKQAEFLFDYYMARGEEQKANNIWKSIGEI